MTRSGAQLRTDALAIWQAAVDAVRSERLVRETMRVDGDHLVIGDDVLALDKIRRIAVVGAGKAGAGMVAAVEEILGTKLLLLKQVAGWVNVPADCVRTTQAIRLHPARPAGVNEPMPQGAAGAAEILKIVAELGPDDLCLCLISGGGSALMPAPADAITLADKLALTRHLSAAGANIEQLNTVRKQLSRIKGGGLARACRAGRLVSLIISDVLGDPLDIIASGPTVHDASTPQAALEVLERFAARTSGVRPAVFEYLERKRHQTPATPTCLVTNRIIGNNATAVDAAGQEAVRRGYSPATVSAKASEGPAESVARHLADMARHMRGQPGPDCLISGGEPVVTLAPAERRGLGGRNQQLALAALQRWGAEGCDGICLVSGGTDGEDGPTDAAGAVVDADVAAAARQKGFSSDSIDDFLARNDAYHFFEPLAALVKTGPTHTNVCDVRVVLVDREEIAAG